MSKMPCNKNDFLLTIYYYLPNSFNTEQEDVCLLRCCDVQFARQ
jgi:hypothetical protein